MKDESQKKITKRIFEMRETEIPHNPYTHEQRKLASIAEGDLRKLSKCQKEKFEGELGRLADDDLRNEKNLAIVVITLASRAAILGGVSPELAFTMTDQYIREVEKQTDQHIVAEKTAEYEREFAKQAALSGQGEKRNPHVEKAKDYIYKHLHNVELHQVWEETNLNGDYLCRLFRQQEGCSLENYILREKIRQAKELLQYSDDKIQEIAEYLSFSSQSSFSKSFKKETGMTPKEYRNRYFQV